MKLSQPSDFQLVYLSLTEERSCAAGLLMLGLNSEPNKTNGTHMIGVPDSSSHLIISNG